MNTIKIYLGTDGAVEDLRKDFDLYQYEYQNKLLNVFVPTSIITGNWLDDNVNTGYTCQIKMSAVMPNGTPKLTSDYNMRYVKTLNYNGVEYALFERLMPYAFTIFSGVESGAPILTMSVVNVVVTRDANNDIVSSQIISIASTQECRLDVNPSTEEQPQNPDDPTDLDLLEAQYAILVNDLNRKQNADTTNDTGAVINSSGNDHTVVGNINTLITNVGTNTNDISDLMSEMVIANQQIQDLYTMVGYGVNIVGTWTVQDGLPTDAQVTAKVEEITGNPPIRGQALLVRVDYSSGTDTIYLYVYDGNDWSHFEMQFLNNAENGILGLIEGDYDANELSTANKFMVNISNGKILNMYKVDASGNAIDAKEALDLVNAMLKLGTTAVEKAKKDGNGNNIANTYMTQALGATKTYVQDYATPRALYELNYADYATGTFKHENTSGSNYRKTLYNASLGYFTFQTLTKTTEADILLGNQNGVTNIFWLTTSTDCQTKIRVTTQYVDSDNVTHTLSIQESDTINAELGVAQKVQIESIFDYLTDPITLPSGTTISQVIELHRETSAFVGFTLDSNTTYPSYMALNKIGYVRYSLEETPTGIAMGATSTSIDAQNNLVIDGVGTMEFENGNTTPINTEVLVPMSSSIASGDDLPISSDKVNTALNLKEDKSNKVTSIDNTSTDTQYPSAKCVYDELAKKIRVVDISNWASPLTNEQFAEITTEPIPIIKKDDIYYYIDNVTNSAYTWKPSLPSTAEIIELSLTISTKTLSLYLFGNLALMTKLATNYSASNTYAVGEIVTRGENVYVCNTAITTPEQWTPSHWTQKTIGQIIQLVENEINAIKDGATIDSFADVESALSGKLDKVTGVTTYHQAYVKNNGGAQSMVNYSTLAIAGGLVQRDLDGQVSVPQTPTADAHATAKKYVDDGLANKLDKNPDGTNPLISNNKINTKYIPDEILGQLVFGGTINASTAVATLSAFAQAKLGTTSATITLTNDTTAITGYSANVGVYYVVSTAGTFASISYSVGDWLISLGTKWDKVDNTDEVTSVQIQANSGLTSSTSTAQTGAVSTTIGVDASHKLPTTTEWGNKLDKQTSATTLAQVYGKNADGTQGMYDIAQLPTAEGIVARTGDYNVRVPLSPTSNNDATSKKYVDDGLSGKQATLSTQTAYSAKGTSTKVPQITTNSLGQVTGITEVGIDFPTMLPITYSSGATAKSISSGSEATITSKTLSPNSTYLLIGYVDCTSSDSGAIMNSDVQIFEGSTKKYQRCCRTTLNSGGGACSVGIYTTSNTASTITAYLKSYNYSSGTKTFTGSLEIIKLI